VPAPVPEGRAPLIFETEGTGSSQICEDPVPFFSAWFYPRTVPKGGSTARRGRCGKGGKTSPSLSNFGTPGIGVGP